MSFLVQAGRVRFVKLGLVAAAYCLAASGAWAQHVEGFESGDFSAVPWTASGDSFWRITDDDPVSGTYSALAKGTSSTFSGTASVQFTAYAESVSFDVDATCRALGSQCDLLFYVDGELLLTIDSNGTSSPALALDPGVHTFRWTWDGYRLFTWNTNARLDNITIDGGGVYQDFNGDGSVDLFQDFNGDGILDAYEDRNGNGVADALDDYDRNGIPDALEDTDSNGVPDALQDLNENGTPDGFEDTDDTDLHDFFEDRYLVTSSSHPNAQRWYFDTTLKSNWQRLYPAENGYLFLVDPDPDTVVDLFNGVYTTHYSTSYPDGTHGSWYLHIVAVDADNELIDASRERFQFNVNTAVPQLTSTSHPTPDTGEYRSDFVLDVAWPDEVAPESIAGYYYLVNQSPATVPTTDDAFAVIAPIEIQGNPSGTNWLHLVAVDRMGNLSEPAHYEFTVLALVPVISSPTHPDEERSYATRDVTFEWTVPAAKSVVGYHYVFDQLEGTIPAETDTLITDETITFTNVPVGVNYFHLRSVDEFGALSPSAHFKVTIVELSAPVLSSTTHPDPSLNYDLQNIQFTWEDPEGFAVAYYFVFDEQADTIPTATNTSTTATSRNFLGVDEGFHYFHIRSADSYGNLSPTAHFRVNVVSGSPLTLTTQTVGEGTIASNLEDFMYTQGADVVLTPVPDDGWAFDHWEGDLSGPDNPAAFTMEVDMDVTAVFVEALEPEDVNGDGTVNAIDVQMCINAVLGLDVGDADTDVNGDGETDALDLQAVINAVLNS